MTQALCKNVTKLDLPSWVPATARHYLVHVEAGIPIRELARQTGCHASTILRQVRRFEFRRDDPLVDTVLRGLGRNVKKQLSEQCFVTQQKDGKAMQAAQLEMSNDNDLLTREMPRVLRRLCEKGAVLAVAADMEKAVIVREDGNGASTRTAVVDRHVAEALALQEWIKAEQSGRITRYRITPAGRSELTKLMDESAPVNDIDVNGDSPFADQHRIWGERETVDADTQRKRRVRCNLAESPLTVLARRRDRDGSPFLSDDLVAAGERLREDFELAQMGPRVAQDWDRFLTGASRGSFSASGSVGTGPEAARKRLGHALSDLGPGLSDIVLRCCCFLEGLETSEKRLGWSARSGKIVLRIALMRLKRHYEDLHGPGGGMIG